MDEQIRRLCEMMGYGFSDETLLEQALTHSSFSYERTGSVSGSNEILEFLGDAALNLSVAAYLIQRFPEKNEGDLSRMRAELVNERALARAAKRIGLDSSLRLGKSARAEGSDIPDSILADGVEALIGAVFRDGGYHPASSVALRLLAPEIEAGDFARGTDYKTRLQEYTQKAYQSLPVYRMENTSGPEHQKVFTSAVWVNGERLGVGRGRSIKASEQEAARVALEKIEKRSGAEDAARPHV